MQVPGRSSRGGHVPVHDGRAAKHGASLPSLWPWTPGQSQRPCRPTFGQLPVTGYGRPSPIGACPNAQISWRGHRRTRRAPGAAAKVHTAYLKVRHLRWLSEKRREYDARHAATKLRERSQRVDSNTRDIVRADLTGIGGATDPRPPEVFEIQSIMPCDGTTSQHDERTASGDGKKAACGSTCLTEARRAPALDSLWGCKEPTIFSLPIIERAA